MKNKILVLMCLVATSSLAHADHNQAPPKPVAPQTAVLGGASFLASGYVLNDLTHDIKTSRLMTNKLVKAGYTQAQIEKFVKQYNAVPGNSRKAVTPKNIANYEDIKETREMEQLLRNLLGKTRPDSYEALDVSERTVVQEIAVSRASFLPKGFVTALMAGLGVEAMWLDGR